MDIRLFLSKVIMLIYRSRQVGLDTYDGLIVTCLDGIKINDKDNGFLQEGMTKKLLDYVNELLSNKNVIELETLLLSLEVMLDNDPKLFKIIDKALNRELSEKDIKRVIASLSGEISNYNRERKVKATIGALHRDATFNRGDFGGDFLRHVREQLELIEPLTVGTMGEKDPAIVNEVRFDNKDQVQSVFEEVRKQMDQSAVYQSGWQEFNKMTQAGLRPGEAVGIEALQHNYKTGTSLSLFLQLLRHNKPIMRPQDVEAGKKPLAIRISLEDSLENNFQFSYQYLKANAGTILTPEQIELIDVDEMAQFTVDELSKTGFEVIMVRVNPTEWGYAELINYLLGLEAEGFALCIVMIDYLLMLNTAGNMPGGHGTDKRLLLRKTRNFTSARDALFITPAQLSMEAMGLLRNGVTDVRFIKEIAGKNYTADSKQLGQEFDLEIYCHLAYANGKKFLCMGRGKHRLATEVQSEEDKFFILPFPGPNIPVLEDINGSNTGMKTLPRTGDTGTFANTNSADVEDLFG